MSAPPTIHSDDPAALASPVRIRGVLAANPGPLTGPGTTTWVVGHRACAVIDPGPDIPDHVEAILAAAPGGVSHILVTHAHLDHSEAAPRLSRATGAPVLAYGPATAGRSPMMQRLAATAALGGGEGVDAGFRPDRSLADGEAVQGEGWSLTALHTPGHMGNHLCFVLGAGTASPGPHARTGGDGSPAPADAGSVRGPVVFCGDLVMGWATTLISPPEGDLVDFLRSLERLAGVGASVLLPAHGAPIADPAARLAKLAAHRRARTAQIVDALAAGPASAVAIAERLYDIAPALLPAAARSVLSHLLALHELGAATPEGDPATAPWRLAAR